MPTPRPENVECHPGVAAEGVWGRKSSGGYERAATPSSQSRLARNMPIAERAAGGASAASLEPARALGVRRGERAGARIVRRPLRVARARFRLRVRGATVLR